MENVILCSLLILLTLKVHYISFWQLLFRKKALVGLFGVYLFNMSGYITGVVGVSAGMDN